MGKHIVCLTFDFDTMSPFIARGLTTPSPLSRGEFGVVGAQRLLALLKQCDVRSTWFTPGFTIESYPDAAKQVFDEGHEIAHHGWTHMPPAAWSRDEEEADLARANETIRALTGRLPRGYRSPSWDLSPHTIELLLQYGFEYDSSMMANDYTPYRARQGDLIELKAPARFGRETRLIEMPISWTLDDFPHFEYLRMPNYLQHGLMSAQAVLQNWLDDFHYMARTMDWGVITYTCHPFVIGRGHRMLMLERLIRDLLDHRAVFMTMEAAACEFAERTPASTDGSPRAR